MLGALSLPTVTTGFSKNSKAMVPVSIQGITDKVQKMSPLESMKEAFFDIRDGVDNLGTIFSEKISGLNEHLAFRFESLNKILMKIGNISEKDLGLEEIQTDIVKENEIDKDRNKSLNAKDESSEGEKLLATLQERFNSFLDFLAPKSEIAKVTLLGALALGIAALLPKLEKSLEGIFEFTGEKLIPFLDSIFDIKDDETGKFKWDNVLGMTLIAYLTLKALPVIGMFALKKLFTVPGGLRVAGLVGLATWATASIFQTIGDWTAAKDWSADVGASDNKTLNQISGALAGDLKGGIMNSFKNASKFAGIGAFTGFMIGGPVGALVGGVIGGAVGGILGWIGGGQLAQSTQNLIDGVKGIWNSVTQGIRDFFFDREIGTPDGVYTQRSMLGEVKDVMAADFKLMGESIKDFFYDDQGNLFGINFGFLKDILPSIKQIAATILSYLPDWMKPDGLNEKIVEQQKIIAIEQKKLDDNASGVSPLRDIQVRGSNSRIKRAQKKIEKLELKFREKFPGLEPGTSELILGNNEGTSIVGNGDGLMVDKMIYVSKARDRKAEEDKLAKQQAASRSLQNINAITNSDNSVVSTNYYGPGLSLQHGPAVAALEKLSN